MKDGPNISEVASLIGDPARSNMLVALMDGRALTATELSLLANITKQTASSHLSKLLSGGLLAREIQGRHRYYRLAHEDVANAIEVLMGVAARSSGRRARTGPKEPALRKARVCYDHLAGELGVKMLDRMIALVWVERQNDDYIVSQQGYVALTDFGVDVASLENKKRPLCRSCLDWSIRRHHLAGSLGAALLEQITKRNWGKKLEGTRIIEFSQKGEKAFAQWLGYTV